MSSEYKEGDHIPTSVIAKRLYELADAVAIRDMSEFSMSIPVQLDRDADVVISEAAKRLRALDELIGAAKSIGSVDFLYGEGRINQDQLRPLMKLFSENKQLTGENS